MLVFSAKLLMMDDLIQCPKCGKAVPYGKMDCEISEIDLIEHNVHFVVRRFQAVCPNCGPFFHDRVGHHGTITEKQMKQLFPKRERRRLRDALSEGERKPFVRTLAGKREPRDGEIKRWLEVRRKICNQK
jgi:ribosomal protein S27AE